MRDSFRACILCRALATGLLLACAGPNSPAGDAGPAAAPQAAAPAEEQILKEWSVVASTPPAEVTLFCRTEAGVGAGLTGVTDAAFPEGVGAYRIEITAGPSALATETQVSFTVKEPLGSSGRYRVTFWAKSSRPASFAATVRLHEAPWTLLAPDSQVTVTADAEWRAFAIPFAPTSDIAAETETRCPCFLLGELPAGTTLWLAGVTLTELQAPAPPLPLRLSAELLRNPGFEDGTEGWQAQAAELASAEGLGRAGSRACLVRQRQARWGSPAQDIREVLQAQGWGIYDIAASVRPLHGRAEAFAVIHLKDARGERWLVSPRRGANERSFARLNAQFLVAWTGGLQAAEVSVQTVGDTTPDLIVDDVSLRALLNLAKGQGCSASSAAAGQPAAFACDGDPATSWRSATPGEAWIDVDFGDVCQFNGCLVACSSWQRQEYRLEYWDGEWRTAFSGNDLHTPVDELRFAPVASRRVRLRFAGAATPAEVAELGVYTCSGTSAERTNRRVVPPPPADPAQRGARTLVGAIRWDGWCGDRHPVGLGLERAMSPEKYHHRLPFYATVRGPEQIEARCVTQETMGREIAFAKEAGIDYWAFDWYAPGTGLALARELYLASAQRDAIRWCAILGTNPFSAAEQSWLVEQFKAPTYQCVLGRRPLVYLFEANSKQATWLQALREECARAGVPQPFIVCMGWSAAVAEVADACGADALGAYVNPRGERSTFAANMTHERAQWESLRNTGRQMVPTVTTGWDPRPFLDYPVPWYPGATESNWVELATPAEVATQLREALAYVRAHPEATLANTVLVYAWNENAEGGWIVPTLSEVRAAPYPLRLDAVRSVLKPTLPPGIGWEALWR